MVSSPKLLINWTFDNHRRTEGLGWSWEKVVSALGNKSKAFKEEHQLHLQGVLIQNDRVQSNPKCQTQNSFRKTKANIQYDQTVKHKNSCYTECHCFRLHSDNTQHDQGLWVQSGSLSLSLGKNPQNWRLVVCVSRKVFLWTGGSQCVVPKNTSVRK